MFKNVLHTIVSRGLGALLTLLVSIVVSRSMGADGRGEQSLFITNIAFVLIVTAMVGSTSIPYLQKKYPIQLLMLPSLIWAMLISVLSFFLFFLLQHGALGYSIHTAVLAFLNSLTAIVITLLLCREEIRKLNYLFLMQPVLLLVALGAMLFYSGSLTFDLYVYALYISVGLTAIVSIGIAFRILAPAKLFPLNEYADPLKEMFRYGIINQSATVTQMLNTRLSYYMLDRSFGSSPVGIYSNGVAIAESIWHLSRSFAQVLSSRIANISNEKEARTVSMAFMKMCFIACLAVFIPVLLIPDRFYVFLFGQEFAGVYRIILMLAPGIAVYNIAIVLVPFFTNTGRHHISLAACLGGLAITIAGAYYIIPAWREMGAAFVSSCSYAVTSIIFILFFMRGVPFKELVSFGNEWNIIGSLLSKNRGGER